jgi:hypothetical protein
MSNPQPDSLAARRPRCTRRRTRTLRASGWAAVELTGHRPHIGMRPQPRQRVCGGGPVAQPRLDGRAGNHRTAAIPAGHGTRSGFDRRLNPGRRGFARGPGDRVNEANPIPHRSQSATGGSRAAGGRGLENRGGGRNLRAGWGLRSVRRARGEWRQNDHEKRHGRSFHCPPPCGPNSVREEWVGEESAAAGWGHCAAGGIGIRSTRDRPRRR